MDDNTTLHLAVQPPEEFHEPKYTVVQQNASVIASRVRVASFRGRPMLLREQPYPHFVPLRREEFDKIAYPLLGGITRGRMGDVFSYVSNTAEDLSDHDRYILFGLADGLHSIWDMADLCWLEDTSNSGQAIWRSPHHPIDGEERLPFIMELAGGREGLYDDIMQSLAPLVMLTKPDGVIWWVGDGANGKSTLMDAIYKIFPGQLSSITVKRLTDGRDTPSLNGTLANVVKESSEGRIDDTEIYKAIGTHENFRVHKFHSQDDMEIRGNLHHIFSGNSVPTFNDKGFSARRRTFIVPFLERFESDPNFERETFTPEFFGRLIAEMCRYAAQLQRQGFKYKWSADTLLAKAEYDTDANNAEEYASQLVHDGIVAFDSFAPVRVDYENFCAENGYIPLGTTNLRRAITALGFERISRRLDEGATGKIYRLKTVADGPLDSVGMGRPGMYSLPGFQPEPSAAAKAKVPVFKGALKQPIEADRDDIPDEPEVTPEEPEPVSVLKGRW